MKKMRKKKIIAILLSIICAFGLYGCANGSEVNDSSVESLMSDIDASSSSAADMQEENPQSDMLALSDASASLADTAKSPAKPSVKSSTGAGASAVSGENSQQATSSSSLPPSSSPSPSSTKVPASAQTEAKAGEQSKGDEHAMPTIKIQVGNKTFIVILYDNQSTRAMVEKMPFTLTMDDYAAQEKVANLTFDLPAAQSQKPARINAGDLYLWSGNNLVLFYRTFANSYSYVPIGRIMDVDALTDALGSGSVEVTFRISD